MACQDISNNLQKVHLGDKAGGSSSLKDTNAAMMPELPPAKKHTFEEIMADLNKSPLFMTEMEENDDIAALQALNYEGTALENGLDFKLRGNECFKVRGFVDAREFYTKGVQILAQEERKRISEPGYSNEETPADDVQAQRDVLEALYVNRAACHLELDNYRSCWTDCAAALRLNPENLKAMYRSARALLAVDRLQEADDVCAAGLALDATNAALRHVAADIVKRAQQLDAKTRQTAERKSVAQRRKELLQTALKARNILTRTTEHPPDMEDAKVALVPDPDHPASSLVFPVVLLYPEDLESDFVKAFNEMRTLEEHLSYIFPLPWDNSGAYTLAGVSCYVETRDGGVLKLGKRVPLLKILATGQVEVVDDLVKIYVLPKGQAEAWIVKFKKAKAAELAKARSK